MRISHPRWLSKAVFSRPLRLWLRWARASSWIIAVSTARTEICMPITRCMHGQDSSRVLWCMVLDPTAPTKTLLSVDGCQTAIVEWGYHEEHLIQQYCWCHSYGVPVFDVRTILVYVGWSEGILSDPPPPRWLEFSSTLGQPITGSSMTLTCKSKLNHVIYFRTRKW